MKEKNILLLRICKNDFEKIVNIKITTRYLEVKKYWESRVLNKDGNPKIFDEIHIKNGYSSDSPMVILKFKGNNGIVNQNGKDYFEIELGEIIEIKNTDIGKI